MSAFVGAIEQAIRTCRHGSATVLTVLLFGFPAAAQYVSEAEKQRMFNLELSNRIFELEQRAFELETQAAGRRFAWRGATAAEAGDWVEACQNYMLAVTLGGTDGYRQFLAGVTTILNETERETCRMNARVEYAALLAAKAERKAEQARRIAACMTEAGLEGQNESTLSNRRTALLNTRRQCFDLYELGSEEFSACIKVVERETADIEVELEADEATLAACIKQTRD